MSRPSWSRCEADDAQSNLARRPAACGPGGSRIGDKASFQVELVQQLVAVEAGRRQPLVQPRGPLLAAIGRRDQAVVDEVQADLEAGLAGCSRTAASGASPSRASRRGRRSAIRARLAAIACSQAPNRAGSASRGSPRKAATAASWATSSASGPGPSSCRHSRRMLGCQRASSGPNASRSPASTAATSSASSRRSVASIMWVVLPKGGRRSHRPAGNPITSGLGVLEARRVRLEPGSFTLKRRVAACNHVDAPGHAGMRPSSSAAPVARPVACCGPGGT
jgi:hypothetical protein